MPTIGIRTDVIGLPLPIREPVHHEPDENRADHHAEQDRPERAPIAERVLQLLPADDERLTRGPRCDSLVRSSIEAGERDECILEILMAGLLTELVGRAVTRPRVPLAITTIESQSADTSCMTWLEKSTQRPSSRKSADDGAHGARAHHVEAVGGFVEQDVLRVVHERARQRHLRALAMREAGRAPIRDRAHVEQIEQFLGRCASRSLSIPCNAPK